MVDVMRASKALCGQKSWKLIFINISFFYFQSLIENDRKNKFAKKKKKCYYAYYAYDLKLLK